MLTSKEFFNNIIKLLADKAQEEDYIDSELIMIPELSETGRCYNLLERGTFEPYFYSN